MNEELTIENIEQWNEEHPDDCHSPWMGGFDDEYEVIAPEEVSDQSQQVEEIEVPTEYAVLSPQTGDVSIYPVILLCVIAGIIICIIGIYFTKEKNKLDNMKSYNQGWHDRGEFDKEYCKKIDEFNSEDGE